MAILASGLVRKAEQLREFKLVLYGAVPSKKNSRNIFVRNGRIMNVPSDRYKQWHNKASIDILKQWRGCEITEYPVSLDVVIYYGDKRRHDLDNSLGSVMDLLSDTGVIEDDDTHHVSQITLQNGEMDKENPRVEIIIEA